MLSIVAIDGKMTLRGPPLSNSLRNSVSESEANLALDKEEETIVSFFGDHRGILGLLTNDGQIQASSGFRLKQVIIEHGLTIELAIRHIAIAGNEKVVVCSFRKNSDEGQSSDHLDPFPVILEFPSFQALLDWNPHAPNPSFTKLPLPPYLTSSISTLVSNFTNFTLLAASGDVYTWGDPRHSSLGRIPTPSSSATSPHLVDFLGGIRIRKIASGRWITAALSYDNDLYLWGGRPGEKYRIKSLPDLSRREDDEAEVKLVDIDGGVDVADVGVGDGHVVALCGDGRVFAVGRGENGQLGIGMREFEEDWMEVRLRLEDGKRVTEVSCGAWSSFLMVEE